MGFDNIIFYIAGGLFLVFCAVMGFGSQLMPSGNLMRTPSRLGDVMIGLFAIALIVLLLWLIYGGWKYLFGVAPPPEPDVPLFSATMTQEVTHVAFLSPDALQKPAPTKRQARKYCKEYLGRGNSQWNQCVVFMWADANFLPRQFPIAPQLLPAMTANYVYSRDGKIDRFCWLTRGQVVENNCF